MPNLLQRNKPELRGKKNKQKLQARKEVREGNTYVSGMLLFTSEDVLDEKLPESVRIPASLYVDRGVNYFTVIFWDTETTGRDRWNEPCEVAACTKDEEIDSFQTYIK